VLWRARGRRRLLWWARGWHRADDLPDQRGMRSALPRVAFKQLARLLVYCRDHC